jgi:tetratricopeptide (TPR) repeat protein
LISKSAGEFEKLGLVERVAEARIDLSICYWREGAFEEARITLDDALASLGDLDSEQRLRAFLNKAMVEEVSNRGRQALKLHRQAAPLFELSQNHALKGKFHNAYALVLKNLGLAEHREDYLDRALIEFSAASYHFEQARHKRFHGVVENNLGFLFVRLGRFREGQEHLSRARAVAVALKDQGFVAQVDDSRARTFIAEGQFSQAEAVARSSVQALQEGDELSLLSTALTTLGTAHARLGNYSKARAALEKAISVARQGGDSEGGGVAALSMSEELAKHLPFSELVNYYRLAESELMNTRNPETLNRMAKCARLLLSLSDQGGVSQADSGSNANGPTTTQPSSEPVETSIFALEATLDEQVLRYEGELIKRALEAADGSITRAARMLGVTHQGLAFILNGRQKSLLPSRKPAKPRRRSIIRYH